MFTLSTTTTTTVLRPVCPGLPGCTGTRRSTHPPTILIIIQPLSASSIYRDSFRSILLVQITCLTIFSHNLFPCPFSTTSWSGALHLIHFFTQSVYSFRTTCPYHRSLFCCSINIISSIPSLSVNSLLGSEVSRV